jgi:tetraacyldisaccharide 4'-kinase
MLDRALNRTDREPVRLRANPNRLEAGRSLLLEHPEIDVFLLDDGFQHRRVCRDLDLVLISAVEPFGFGHVLPRGLLREPLLGLRRAGAIVLTRADQATAEQLNAIELKVRSYNLVAPIYRAIHSQVGLLSSASSAIALPMEQLSETRFFAFCGIGDPASFDRQLRRFDPRCVGRRWFGDHHRYTVMDLKSLIEQAKDLGAEMLLTTEKDWVKIEPFAGEFPIWRVVMNLDFVGDGAARLIEQLRSVLAARGNK